MNPEQLIKDIEAINQRLERLEKRPEPATAGQINQLLTEARKGVYVKLDTAKVAMELRPVVEQAGEQFKDPIKVRWKVILITSLVMSGLLLGGVLHLISQREDDRYKIQVLTARLQSQLSAQQAPEAKPAPAQNMRKHRTRR